MQLDLYTSGDEVRPDGLGGLLGAIDIGRVDGRDARVLKHAGQRRGLCKPLLAERLTGPVGVADEIDGLLSRGRRGPRRGHDGGGDKSESKGQSESLLLI